MLFAAAASWPGRGTAPGPLRELFLGALPTLSRLITSHGLDKDLPAREDIALTIYLALRDPAKAEAAAAAVSDPASSAYGHFITPAQFKASFAATDQTVDTVRGWLTEQGFQIVSVSPTNRSIRVHGPASAFAAAFGVHVKMYRRDGQTVPAATQTPRIPADLAHAVLSVGGISITTAADRAPAPPLPVFVRPPSCSNYFGEKYPRDLPPTMHAPLPYRGTAPLAVCGYTASQVRQLYGTDGLVHSGLDGRARTVAIVDAYASPTIVADVNTWASRQGEPPLGPRQFRQYPSPSFYYGHSDAVSGDVCDERTWYSEETLDIEAVHGMAPAADIVYMPAASCQLSDMTDALQRIADGHLADIVSGSFSFFADDIPAGDLAAAHATFIQAAAEGIGMYFAAGDSGDNLLARKKRGVQYPASDPLVTAVGGTSAAISRTGSRLFEFGWATATTTLSGGTWKPAAPGTFLNGGGGGVSRLFTQPSYQIGVVPSAISSYFGGRPGRAVPDVAAVGDPDTGYLVGQTETLSDGTAKYVEYRLGGTSLSAPLFAGIVALAEQVAGRAVGFANYALYQLAGTHAFYDPSSQNRSVATVETHYVNGEDATAGYVVELRTMNQQETINLRPGYDDVTGLGTPNGIALLAGLVGLGDARNLGLRS